MLARAHLAAAPLAASLVLAGCSPSSSADVAPSPECLAGAGPVAEALRDAPRDVRLVDGTPISACVRQAVTESDLQNVGLVLTRVAEDLEDAARTTPRAALELGYLSGAARRGAPDDSSLQAELVYRLGRSAAVRMSAAAERALAQGMRAGERGG